MKLNKVISIIVCRQEKRRGQTLRPYTHTHIGHQINDNISKSNNDDEK